MKIIEKFIQGKRGVEKHCEDGIFISEDFVAVIDGVSSKGKTVWGDGLTSGAHAKNVIIAELGKMPADIERDALFEGLNRALCEEYLKSGMEPDKNNFLRACLLVYSRHYNEIWALGDCQALINGTLFSSPMLVDDLMSDLRAFVIESAKIIEGLDENSLYTKDIGREAVFPFIKMQYAFENRADSPFGFGVLNGFDDTSAFLKTYKVKKGDTVVMASDGYPRLLSTLDESEGELKRMLEGDPLRYKENRGTKGIVKGNLSFDDRCYIRFEV